MGISVNRETKRIKEIGEKEMERLPGETAPISYFGNLMLINQCENSLNSSVPEKDLNKLNFLFPKETEDYDILITDLNLYYLEVFNYLLENKYKEKYMIDKRDIKFTDYGESGYINQSPYKAYGKNEDCPIDVFLGRVGAIELDEEDKETLKVSNLYATLQPGEITKDRIYQYLPTYILGRASREIDYDECKETCNKLFSKAFGDRKKNHPSEKKFIGRIGGINIYITPFRDFLKETKKENNILHNLSHKFQKKFADENVGMYCAEAFEILTDALEKNIKKYKP